MRKMNLFHYRWIEVEPLHKESEIHPSMFSYTEFVPAYDLGRSNHTALPKGGLTIGVYLKNDKGEIVNSIQDSPEDNFSIVWVMAICSSEENFNRYKAGRIAMDRAKDSSRCMVSKNYDWDTVKKISDKLVSEVKNLASKRFHKKNGLFDALKNSFNIDAWVQSGCKFEDVIIQADVLVAKSAT